MIYDRFKLMYMYTNKAREQYSIGFVIFVCFPFYWVADLCRDTFRLCRVRSTECTPSHAKIHRLLDALISLVTFETTSIHIGLYLPLGTKLSKSRIGVNNFEIFQNLLYEDFSHNTQLICLVCWQLHRETGGGGVGVGGGGCIFK